VDADVGGAAIRPDWFGGIRRGSWQQFAPREELLSSPAYGGRDSPRGNAADPVRDRGTPRTKESRHQIVGFFTYADFLDFILVIEAIVSKFALW